MLIDNEYLIFIYLPLQQIVELTWKNEITNLMLFRQAVSAPMIQAAEKNLNQAGMAANLHQPETDWNDFFPNACWDSKFCFKIADGISNSKNPLIVIALILMLTKIIIRIAHLSQTISKNTA